MKIFIILILTCLSGGVFCQLNEHICGRGTNLDLTARIVGGTNAKKGDWGWQVAINKLNRIICSGVLLSSQWVATAAHCVPISNQESIKYLDVSVGLNDKLHPDEWSENRKISKVFLHENFNYPFKFQNDIALLKLESPVSFDSREYKVVPICIPGSSETFAEKTGWVTGYGSLYSGGSVHNKLQQTDVPILNESACEKSFADIDSKTQVCAGYKGLEKDTCEGDGGAPLVSKNAADGKWYIVGLDSYGPYPCGSGSVYTRLSAYRQWIDEIISLN